MKNYVYMYHSSQNSQPSEESLRAWNDWFSTLGDKVVDPGSPITGETAILKNGTVHKEHDTVIGYAVIEANSLGEAIELAKGNPLADAPGCEVRVYETGQM